jgi:glutathione S-transferase
MDLYFSPLACSMATRVALYEAGAEANYLEVDPPTKTVLSDGTDFRTVNPIADRFPQSGLGAAAGIERTRLHQWLCFIGTELHKGLFIPVLDRKAPQETKAYALEKNLSRLDYLDNYLKGRDFLLDHFSVADAYLVTVINWTMATPPIELAKWPNVKAYYERLRQRPSIAKAIAEEFELYKAEQARKKAAA